MTQRRECIDFLLLLRGEYIENRELLAKQKEYYTKKVEIFQAISPYLDINDSNTEHYIELSECLCFEDLFYLFGSDLSQLDSAIREANHIKAIHKLLRQDPESYKEIIEWYQQRIRKTISDVCKYSDKIDLLERYQL